MFKFSSKTEVNKEFKVSDFLKEIHASKEARTDAKKIKSIVFKNVINSSTMNCLENKYYKNIYVIEITLLVREIPKIFIDELDKNISFHTYFVFKYGNEVSTLMAYKDIDDKVNVDRYYSHDFHLPKYLEIPIINSVPEFYKLLLSYESKIPYRKQESPDEFITRVKKINKYEFQISKTEKAILYESQPRKKFEYNERLRKYKKELNDLFKMED